MRAESSLRGLSRQHADLVFYFLGRYHVPLKIKFRRTETECKSDELR
jgi:hypothetical protein